MTTNYNLTNETRRYVLGKLDKDFHVLVDSIAHAMHSADQSDHFMEFLMVETWHWLDMPIHTSADYGQKYDAMMAICETLAPKIKNPLNEIGYASLSRDLGDDRIVFAQSEIVGKIDHHNVGRFVEGDSEIFSLMDDSRILAFIVISHGNELRQMRSKVSRGGYITALMKFVCHELMRTIILPADEKLTYQGLQWVKSIIYHNGKGLKLTDQNGNYPDYNQIDIEWTKLLKFGDKGEHGPTSIIFESNNDQNFVLNPPDKFPTGWFPPVTNYIGDFTIR